MYRLSNNTHDPAPPPLSYSSIPIHALVLSITAFIFLTISLCAACAYSAIVAGNTFTRARFALELRAVMTGPYLIENNTFIVCPWGGVSVRCVRRGVLGNVGIRISQLISHRRDLCAVCVYVRVMSARSASNISSCFSSSASFASSSFRPPSLSIYLATVLMSFLSAHTRPRPGQYARR